MKNLYFSLLAFSLLNWSCKSPEEQLQSDLKEFIKSIEIDSLGGKTGVIEYTAMDNDIYKVKISYTFSDTVKQDNYQVSIQPNFTPNFNWTPHLTPTDSHIIDQHSFRSPAMIVSTAEKLLTIIPDMDIMLKETPVRWNMDMDASRNILKLGMSNYKVDEHVLYKKESGAVYPPGTVEFGFYIIASTNKEKINNPWRQPLAFMWEHFGKELYAEGQPIKGDMSVYVKRTYDWLFNWPAVWQEFDLNGTRVGAGQYMVNITQSPNFTGSPSQGGELSLWNQAWFSSLRSASGMYRYGKLMQDTFLMNKAILTKELALAFPQQDGLFDAVVSVASKELGKDSVGDIVYTVFKPLPWEGNYRFGNNDRNPANIKFGAGTSVSPKHILDMSWTAYLMLKWYEELEKDERLLEYATKYADKLVSIQYNNGYFPAYISDDVEMAKWLNNSPESSMSVTFLLEMYTLTKDDKYKKAALKGMQTIIDDVIPSGRWEDFETYWSCSRNHSGEWYGNKIARNNMYKQCNFSIWWTSEALWNCYKTTGEEHYLKLGQRCLDELLMTQASWQPPYIHVNTLGGFGVMNGDAEWNDSRQCLFAETIVNYGKELNNQEYIQRGLAALRSSFIMMYCPENPKTKELWETKWPHFNEKDYGFMMENYGHRGKSDKAGAGIGVFTIYDWGNGAASEAYNRMIDHYGKDFIINQ